MKRIYVDMDRPERLEAALSQVAADVSPVTPETAYPWHEDLTAMVTDLAGLRRWELRLSPRCPQDPPLLLFVGEGERLEDMPGMVEAVWPSAGVAELRYRLERVIAAGAQRVPSGPVSRGRSGEWSRRALVLAHALSSGVSGGAVRVLQSLFEHAPTLMLLLDGDGRLLQVSRSLEQVSGYGVEELSGELLSDWLASPAEGVALRGLLRGLGGEVERGTLEVTLRSRNGTLRQLGLSIMPLEAEGLTLGRFLAIAEDVTELRELGSSLRQEQALLATSWTLLDRLCQGVRGREVAGELLRQACRVTGSRAGLVAVLDGREGGFILEASQGWLIEDPIPAGAPLRLNGVWSWLMTHPEILSESQVSLPLESLGGSGSQAVRQVLSLPILGPEGLLGRLMLADAPQHCAALELQALVRLCGIFGATLITERQTQRMQQAEERYRLLLDGSQDVIYRFWRGKTLRLEYISPSVQAVVGLVPEEVLADPQPLLGLIESPDLETLKRDLWGERGGEIQLQVRRADGAVRHLILHHVPTQLQQDGEVLVHGIARDITDKVLVEQQTLQQLSMLQGLHLAVRRLGGTLEANRVGEEAVRTCVDEFGVRMAWVGMLEPDGRFQRLACRPAETCGALGPEWIELQGEGSILGQVVKRGEPRVLDTSSLETGPVECRGRPGAMGVFPLVSRGRPVGLVLLYSPSPVFFAPNRMAFLSAWSYHLAAALENARLYGAAERRYRHVSALRNIDMAINSSTNLAGPVHMLLGELLDQLRVDAVDVLLHDKASKKLRFFKGRGFMTDALRGTNLSMGEGYAGRVAEERRLLHVDDLLQRQGGLNRSPLLEQEGFQTYLGVPLLAHGRLLGVLELFHRSRLQPDGEWHDMLEAMANQAAAAIDKVQLMQDLQRARDRLCEAYDTTLEGWSRALDLRDKETEGHTQRVTEVTVILAQALGVPESELLNFRRGALLHDIGKMAIPDSVLLKEGPLSPTEWEVMRLHPVYAYELLAPIDYLRPSLDIPYCHHEYWDGTGYPRGLRGDQIPFSARIFAVVDVWDALRSDRPYRQAWPDAKVLDYIQERSGTQFEPKVVEAFMLLDLERRRSPIRSLD